MLAALPGRPRMPVARFGDTAIEALAAMRAAGASAAPVVDGYGALAANVSLSDVKALARRGAFGALRLPVHQFLATVQQLGAGGVGGGGGGGGGSPSGGAGVGRPDALLPSICVKRSTQLASLILTLAATRIHTIYMVDELMRPQDSVRTADVLRFLVADDEDDAVGTTA